MQRPAALPETPAPEDETPPRRMPRRSGSATCGARRAPAARRCAPRCAGSPVGSGAGARCGSAARHPSSSSCSRRWAPPTARCSPSSRSASSAPTQLDAAAVEAALADQLGTPLPLVDESAVKAALVTFPLVESYSLEARPPHELVVRIVERTPIGLIQTRAGYTLVDAAGVALSTTATPPPGRPVVTVEGGTDSPAFEAVGQVMRSLPAVDPRAGDGGGGLDARRRDPDARRRERAGRLGERRGLGAEGARPGDDDGGPPAGIRERLRRVVAERRSSCAESPSRASRTGSARDVATRPRRSRRCGGIRILSCPRNCIPGNSLYLY